MNSADQRSKLHHDIRAAHLATVSPRSSSSDATDTPTGRRITDRRNENGTTDRRRTLESRSVTQRFSTRFVEIRRSTIMCVSYGKRIQPLSSFKTPRFLGTTQLAFVLRSHVFQTISLSTDTTFALCLRQPSLQTHYFVYVVIHLFARASPVHGGDEWFLKFYLRRIGKNCVTLGAKVLA